MNRKFGMLLFAGLLTFVCGVADVFMQTTTASISGTITDERQAVVPGATVTARNTETGASRTAQTDGEGRYNLVNLPIGAYEVTVEAANFSKYVQTGITLLVNQNAAIDVGLKAGSVQEIVTVTENASLLNTTTPEISTRFDERRLAELPIATNRNVYNVLLSVPGVSQLGSGQTGFTNGTNFSSNGGRLRSNNFMIDGQDVNDPSVAGGQIALNNPDAIQEVRIITNQFLPEYGRNSGSVVNIIGKSGTNDFHGSAFIFNNSNRFNACSNLDKRAAIYCNPNSPDESRRNAPPRKEFQYGFTFGGPLTFLKFGEGGPTFFKAKDRTFFFGDFQRWTDRAFLPGTTISGAPTAAGRALLQQFANRPQVAALLQFLPAGAPNGNTTTVNGVSIPLGSITGAAPFVFNDNQGSFRIDHRISDAHLLYGRYRANRNESLGTGQATPSGLTNVVPTKTQAATIVLNSILSSKVANEARIAWTRYDSSTNASDPLAESIPSIEVPGLGLTGFNAGATRTALGLGVNLPQFRINDTYQIQDAISYTTGNHNLKFGVDARRTDVKSFFFPTVRGRLSYTSLQDLVNDVATVATVNLPLRGGDIVGFYRWYEFYAYAQDEWRVTNNLTLTYGARYEYPGDSFGYLKDLNQRILAANNNNAAFRFDPSPRVDKNNIMPRVGFAYTPRTGGKGVLGFITGDDRMVIRGGYARTYDANFININLNVFSSFPFVASVDVPALPGVTPVQRPNAFATLQALRAAPPNVSNPGQITRTVVSEDFHAPATDQFSLEVQREITKDAVLKVGYIRTRGTGLFQTVDGNPRQPFSTTRVNPNQGVIRLRTNSAQSTYDAIQVSFNKRLSNNFSAGFHYTYSSFIDDASELFNPSNAEVAVSQDSFNRAADRSRSSFDRPHRFTGNFVYELPFFREQKDFISHVLGGFQVNSFFTFQSGAPFTVLLGADPTGALGGIDGLVGNAIRPNVRTNMDLSSMTLREIRAQCGAPVAGNNCPNLFSTLLPGQRVGNAGRNILRSDGFKLVDFGVIKNTRITETVRFQLRADMFNVFNIRSLGVPEGRISAQNFLDEGGTNGGNRRIIFGARVVF